MKKVLCLVSVGLFVLSSCQAGMSPADSTAGGRLMVAQPAGPTTFNPLFANDGDSLTVVNCLQAKLIRLNHQTQQMELDLAESADFSPDGRALTLRLRKGLKFSDGLPLTADDVLFTFQVIYDPEIPSPVADILKIGGEKIRVEKLDDLAVRFRFPQPTPDAEDVFDNVHILPEHILGPLYRQGDFETAWGISTPPQQVVGAGPFRLKSIEQGRRVVIARNPHYWKRDDEGQALPYLDEIDFDIIPDKSARLLRFQRGELDVLSPLRAEDVQALQSQVEAGEVVRVDLGASLIIEMVWFNLNPGRHRADGPPFVDPIKLKWFSDVRFRQAVAAAIDRKAIVDVVFLGKATVLAGPFSPSEARWYNSELKPYRYDPHHAGALLDQLGLKDRDGDGIREDERGRPARFTLITNAGNRMRGKMGLMIQQDLKRIGVEVVFVPVEARTLLGKIMNDFDYEACLFALAPGTGPNGKSDFLRSDGTLHWWHLGQTAPATPWEAEIDELMIQQAKTLDRARRKKLFDRVQQIMADEVPVIPLVARNLLVAARRRVGNLKPGIIHDYLLWNAEELFVH